MNDKQRAFVREYLIDRNATQAAIRAGYSEKTAYSIGQRLLKKVEVAEAIKAGESEHAERCAVTIESLTKELDEDRLLARDNSQPSAAISAVLGKAKLHGFMTDKADVNVTGNITFETIYESKPDD
jgi:phage terminase small subunit